MRFEILGPLRVTIDDREVVVRAGRESTLIAMLLLHANRPVSHVRLVDAIWATRPPQNARNQLQGLVSRLRRRLADAGVTDQPITTEAAGYCVSLKSADLDVTEFRRLVTEARADAGAGRHGQARDSYRTALSLWRGPTLAGIDNDLVRQAAVALDEERAQAHEECFDAGLAAGAAGELISELTDLVRQYRHRERLHRALMLALYRAGRQADALAAFRNARELLSEELGMEPGSELQQLHHAILNRDPALDVASRPSPPTPALTTPRELPADVAGFTGRGDALDTLNRLVSENQSATGPVVISAIAGTAGVGKTALAVHWAHRFVDWFPDGQLFVDLRGYHPDQPMAPADALARFLTVLGVSGQDIPIRLDERAARYRSKVAGRRMLIVLDNAATVDQVRPLLPGTSTCTVVVTSRDTLAGLVARHGAQRLDLDLLPAADAIELLCTLIGPRAEAEPEAVALLADRCARLPLALRVAAELAVARSAVPLAKLAVELDDDQRRLDLLAAGEDPYTAVKVVFSWSIRHLPSAAARTFRLLGLHPGPDLDPYAVAALADSTVDEARWTLDLLARAHLLYATGRSRYGMHDLLRAYAADAATREEPDDERQAAIRRLLAHYRYTASIAMDAAHPYERDRRPTVPRAGSPTPDLTDPASAIVWLDSELPNLLAAAWYAAHRDLMRYTLDIATTLHRHLRTRGRYRDAELLHHRTLATARSIGDRPSELNALIGLGDAHRLQGDHLRSLDAFGKAMEIAIALHDGAAELEILCGLGDVHLRQGRHEQATKHYLHALEVGRLVGNRSSELDALTGLAAIHWMQGMPDQALEEFEQALAIGCTTGDRIGQLDALLGIGRIHVLQDRLKQALRYYTSALDAARTTGHSASQLNALASLGDIHRLQNQYEQAANHYHAALELAREVGDRNAQFEAVHGLGRLSHATGQPQPAFTFHQQALELATDLQQPGDQARAYDGLAQAAAALGQATKARRYWQQVLDILARIGVDRTEDGEASVASVRTSLDNLDREYSA